MGIFGISVLLYLASNLTFLILILFIFSIINFTSLSLPILLVLPSHNSPPSLSPLSDWGPIAYPSILALQVSGRLCASSPTKAKQGSPSRKKITHGQATALWVGPDAIVWDTHKGQTAHLLDICGKA